MRSKIFPPARKVFIYFSCSVNSDDHSVPSQVAMTGRKIMIPPWVGGVEGEEGEAGGVGVNGNF